MIAFAFWRERRAGRGEGLRPAGPLVLLLAPYILPGMLIARASPAGLGQQQNVNVIH